MSVANLTTDLLESRSFPQIAAALKQRASGIIQRWEQAVRQHLPGADELTLAQVRDDIPAILDQLATALASNRPTAVQELRETSQMHGTARFHQQYNVRELIIEYRLLRRIVIEEIYEATGGRLNATEMIVLDMGVDTAFQQGLLTFIHHQREQIRAGAEAESKYLRFLSHDLRNNLNQVVLVLELLKGRLDGLAEFAEDHADVVSSHRTVLQTISGMDALLQAERLRKGAVQPRRESVQLAAGIADLLRQASPQAAEKGLTLEAVCPPEARIESDRELIALVLQNFLGNAIKYSPSGTVRVVVSKPAQDAGGWTISVIDQGPGISDSDKRRIFDAFARGNTHGQPGVGLGLTIANEAAKLLEATIAVESEPGTGATFRLILP
ncbi:MAG TPA: sensor histidine kinase [Tepidisphaeraceae bacterium]|nr:sensor histidine kinase [Tepidisphaeraceae bacterium]